MANKIFIEENEQYQFDFSQAIWATDQLNDIFHTNHQMWSDADFVTEYLSGTQDANIKLLFVEYKNSDISTAVNPGAFNPASDKKVNNVVRKFLDSLSYMMATGKERKNYYVYIVEFPNSDSVTRRLLREKIAQRLPFEFQTQSQFQSELISRFEVLSIEEWNNHDEYSKFPITSIST
ncbi:MAG: hypothetical protein RR776_13570 [Niameybacter sp.]|uniref:hypothetical protein n=1 Tax=Niameybacter sp. TaxID=2033640 RepID=UPI002FC7AC6B